MHFYPHYQLKKEIYEHFARHWEQDPAPQRVEHEIEDKNLLEWRPLSKIDFA